MPAIFGHCEAVYRKMEEESKVMTVEGQEVQVYEGFLTKLFNDLNLAVPYYTAVMRELRKMDCVRQIRRGGGTAPSRWMLVQAPVEEVFQASHAKPIPDGHNGRPTTKQLMQMMRDINARLTVLEERVG
jgi:hypothetical protein